MADGSGKTCHGIRQNVRHIGFYIWFGFNHITAVDMSFCTSLRNFIQIGPPSAEKMTCRFLRWWISAILGFRGPIMGSLKSPCTISSIETIALNCLVFEKIAFFCMLATDRQTNKQTDGQHRYTKPLLLSRAAALKYIIHICTTGGTLFLAQYTCVLTSFHGSGRQMVRCTAN